MYLLKHGGRNRYSINRKSTQSKIYLLKHERRNRYSILYQNRKSARRPRKNTLDWRNRSKIILYPPKDGRRNRSYPHLQDGWWNLSPLCPLKDGRRDRSSILYPLTHGRWNRSSLYSSKDRWQNREESRGRGWRGSNYLEDSRGFFDVVDAGTHSVLHQSSAHFISRQRYSCFRNSRNESCFIDIDKLDNIDIETST